MRAYLRSININYRKAGSIPDKADINAQQEFHDEELQPRLEESKAGKRDVYFIDAAYTVGGGWILLPPDLYADYIPMLSWKYSTIVL